MFQRRNRIKMFKLRDVTKLVKIRIHRMHILTFKISRMRMRIVAFIYKWEVGM